MVKPIHIANAIEDISAYDISSAQFEREVNKMRDNKLSRRYLLELVPFPIVSSYPYKDIEDNFDILIREP